MPLDRRDFLRLSALAVPLGGTLLAACSGADDPVIDPPASAPQDTATPSAPGRSLADIAPDAGQGLQLIEAEAEQVVGSSRFAFGLLGPDDSPLGGADVTVYAGRQADAPPQSEVKAIQLVEGEGIADKAIYVAPVPFPAAGTWLIAAVATTTEGAALKGGTTVEVLRSSASPVPGQRAISVATPTRRQPRGAAPLCSRKPPCSMHAVSLDDALRRRRPVVVTFAAPAFCRTETCGPVVSVVEQAARGREAQVDFIHVEAYGRNKRSLAPPLVAWRFTSEPWTYFVDATGTVTDRLSGAVGGEEVAARLDKLTG